jgi:toxin ParE1/3/4
MTVSWTNAALDNLLAIHTYILQSSPVYADTLVERLIERTEQLTEFPYSGRTVAEFDMPMLRERIESKYRIIYRIKPESIDIIAVLHSARNLE